MSRWEGEWGKGRQWTERSVVINGLNWISVERLIGDCRPPEDGVEQNCEQNYPGVERAPREGGRDTLCARTDGRTDEESLRRGGIVELS